MERAAELAAEWGTATGQLWALGEHRLLCGDCTSADTYQRLFGPDQYAPSKQQLLEGLAVAIQQRHIRYPDGGIAHELASFGYAYTRTGVQYAAPEGLHDDCVYALALAWRCYEQHRISAVACPVSLSTRRSPWDFDSSGHRTGSW